MKSSSGYSRKVHRGGVLFSIYQFISIQEQKYAVYRTLPDLKSGAVFADCYKIVLSILSSEEMVVLFDFIFVRRSFL